MLYLNATPGLWGRPTGWLYYTFLSSRGWAFPVSLN
jgi:hypothetical protein